MKDKKQTLQSQRDFYFAFMGESMNVLCVSSSITALFVSGADIHFVFYAIRMDGIRSHVL